MLTASVENRAPTVSAWPSVATRAAAKGRTNGHTEWMDRTWGAPRCAECNGPLLWKNWAIGRKWDRGQRHYQRHHVCWVKMCYRMFDEDPPTLANLTSCP